MSDDTATDATAMGVPTLEEVAVVAGVSRATVSRVINDSPRLTPAAIAAVERAIAELGYVPNRAARILASRRTFAIALVIPENTAKFFADPYFAQVIQGVALELSSTAYTLSLLIAPEADAEKTRNFLQAGNVDGALVLSHHSDDRSYLALARTLPVVFGGRPMSAEGGEGYYVDVDNVAAARLATEHLVASGRRRIATIAGPADMAAGLDRVDGWRAGLEAAGLEADLVERGDFTPAGGADAMRRILDRGVRIDGLFAASSQMAAGALGVLRDAGLTVPDDVAITSIDNDYFAENASPRLTTVEQPSVEVGRTMARLIVDRIEGRDVAQVTILPTRLVHGGSA